MICFLLLVAELIYGVEFFLDRSGVDVPRCGSISGAIPCYSLKGIFNQLNLSDFNDVYITIGSILNNLYDGPYEINFQRILHFIPRNIGLTFRDKAEPYKPIFDIKTGGLYLQDCSIIHWPSLSEDGALIVASGDSYLHFFRVIFSSVKPNIVQRRPYIFYNSTQPFILSYLTIEKSSLSTDAIIVDGVPQFQLTNSVIRNINGYLGMGSVIHIINTQSPSDIDIPIEIKDVAFFGIGENNAVQSVIRIENEIIKDLSLIDQQRVSICNVTFVGCVGHVSGAIEFINNGDSYDLFVTDVYFFNNTGLVSGDIYVSKQPEGRMRIEIEGSLSVPGYQFDLSKQNDNQTSYIPSFLVERENRSLLIISLHRINVDNSYGDDSGISGNENYPFMTISGAMEKLAPSNKGNRNLIQLKSGIYNPAHDLIQEIKIGKQISAYNSQTLNLPMEITLNGQGQNSVIYFTSQYPLRFIILPQSDFLISNLTVTSKDTIVDYAFLSVQGGSLSVMQVSFSRIQISLKEQNCLINSGQDYLLIKISQCNFVDIAAGSIISIHPSSAKNAKVIIEECKFITDEISQFSQWILLEAAIIIRGLEKQLTEIKIIQNQFKNLFITKEQSAPIIIDSKSAHTQIMNCKFEDISSNSVQGVIIFETGTVIEDILTSCTCSNTDINENKRIKEKVLHIYNDINNKIQQTDYSYLLPEFINRVCVSNYNDSIIVQSQLADRKPLKLMTLLNNSINEVIDMQYQYSLYPFHMYIVGNSKPYDARSIEIQALILEIEGIEQWQIYNNNSDDERLIYDKSSNAIIQASGIDGGKGLFVVGVSHSMTLRLLTIRHYLKPKAPLIIVNENAELKIFDVTFEKAKLDNDTSQDPLEFGFIKLVGNNMAYLSRVLFDSIVLRALDANIASGVAIIGHNVNAFSMTRVIFQNVIADCITQAVSAIRIGVLSGKQISISNCVFQFQTSDQKRSNTEVLENEFRIPAVYVWSETLNNILLPSPTTLIITDTRFIHCHGGALRVRDVTARIGSSCRFSENKPFWRGYETMELNVQVEGGSLLDAEEESFVPVYVGDSDYYYWILSSGNFTMFSGSIAKNQCSQLFTIPELKSANAIINNTENYTNIILSGKRLYLLDNVIAEFFQAEKEDKALQIGLGQLYQEERQTRNEKELSVHLTLESIGSVQWYVRLIYGLGKRTKEVKLRVQYV